MTNAELREIVFNKIKEFGFKIYNVENVDGYFICDMGKDSVTHFRLRGKGMWKHWKFGLWLNENYLSEEELNKVKEMHKNGEWGNEPKVIQLFAQHDTWIDKFKPSRSALLFELDTEDVNKFLNGNDKNIYGDSYTFDSLKRMLGMMCRHPFMCYDEYCGDYVGYTDESFFWNYVKYESKEIFKKISIAIQKIILVPYTKLKIALCKRNKLIKDIKFIDFEKEYEGFSTNYLYGIKIYLEDDAPEDECTKVLNFWWHKKEYGKRRTYKCIVEITDIIQNGEHYMYMSKENK